MKKEMHETNLEADALLGINEGAAYSVTWKEPIRAKTLASFFLVTCVGGLFACIVYIAYFYFNLILKENFGYPPEDIIRHNFFLAFISLITNVFITYLNCRVHPLKINKVRGILALLFMISLLFLILNSTTPARLFLIQALILALHDIPSCSVFISHFPLYRRFTFTHYPGPWCLPCHHLVSYILEITLAILGFGLSLCLRHLPFSMVSIILKN